MTKVETDVRRQMQAGQEIVELLRRVGVIVKDYDIDADVERMTFDLQLTLSMPENERPLEAIDE